MVQNSKNLLLSKQTTSTIYCGGDKFRFQFKDLPYLREDVTQEDINSDKQRKKFLPNEQNGEIPPVTNLRSAFVNGHDFTQPEPRVPDLTQKIVVLELIAAKLCYPYPSSISISTSTSTPTLTHTPMRTTNYMHVQQVTPRARNRSRSSTPINISTTSPVSPAARTIQTSASKRYVGYSILVKSVPGLDPHQTMIERRFSDFLALFQSIKHEPHLAQIFDSTNFNFPRKIIVGNFSAINIAERSMEFDRLLSLCMSEQELKFSSAFASFLLDKELREAQRLYLKGELWEAQSLIESVYYIEEKIYIESLLEIFSNTITKPRSNGDVLPRMRKSNDSTEHISRNKPNGISKYEIKNENLICICYRLLITFSMMFLIYCDMQEFSEPDIVEISEMKNKFKQFHLLISSQNCFDCLQHTCLPILSALLVFLFNISNDSSMEKTEIHSFSSENKQLIEKCLKDLNISIDDPEACHDHDLVQIIQEKPLIS